MKMIIYVLLFLCITIIKANASWKNPVEYLTGEWSDSITGFGLIQSESSFEYPDNYCTTADGYLVISDSSNKRVKIYKNGINHKIISSPELDPDVPWPAKLFCSGNTIVTDNHDTKKIFNVNGELLKTITEEGFVYAANDSYIATAKKNNYKLFDTAFNLLKSDVVPFKEIGYSKGNKIYVNNRTLCVSSVNVDRAFKLDSNYNIYITTTDIDGDSKYNIVTKYNKCGQIISSVRLSNDDVREDDKGTVIRNREVLPPYIASNGDIYEAIASDNYYNILKWEWIDTPMPTYMPIAPANPSIQIFGDRIRIIWDNSDQDPGCVTGYEVTRAEDPEGTFVKLTTVLPNSKLYYIYDDKAVVKGKRYYYKIRTMVDDLFSDYSVVINGIINP